MEKEISECFSSALARAQRQTQLSKAIYQEDLETLKGFTIEEILDTDARIDVLERMIDNQVNDDLYNS